MPLRTSLAPLDPVTAASVVVAVAPFGYLLGWLALSHVAPVATAVWLSTVLVSVVALLVASRRSTTAS
ncbi:hypothetical protein DU504_03515 [Haloplanus salinus]|uniref:Uncharacterized protein n=1 Tax=Haloplanus salinus TaxID=1126245 RepID=A0A368N8D5_9EURY|nr:hypothetical protein [Haloplanus salinus]RCU46456.1 hypothetical protein DU504_03515 [Haloplanus salinus]